MTRTVALIVIAVFAGSCASRSPEQTIVDDAAAALGGAERIQSLTALAAHRERSGAERRPEPSA